jgi:hypothetical protein
MCNNAKTHAMGTRAEPCFVIRYRREPFGSKAQTDAALAAFPNIAKVCATVAAHPQIVKWLAMRGITNF